VKIGVTGHRYLKETGKIIKGVDKALKMIEETFGLPLIMFSALAEGADQLVVFRAQAMWEDTQLVALLPMKLDDYLSEFTSFVSKAEIINLMETADQVIELNQAGSQTSAYLEAGKQILNHCDVLVAVWDGQESQGEGGTAEIVTLARERGLPLAWVRSGNRQPGTNKPTSLGKEQGVVTYERFHFGNND
jgi:hypothetical protein